jgi:DNA invertase Pin-like site-specific DNA recombinase
MRRAGGIVVLETATLAVQYLRMSTDDQQYSIENQIDAIREFADAHGLRITRTYADPGQSGLTLEHRPGLKRLLQDVAKGHCPFSKVLVYDVSRWGRFQDLDESAAYEFHCRSHGVEVHYCVEVFQNDHGPVSSLLKHMKRSMAAELSRERSVHISRAKKTVARLGYWVGSPAPYGYERWAVSTNGRRLKLEPGERKHITSWRTVLDLGPPAEVACVRRMFRLFVDHGRGLKHTVDSLNVEGWRTPGGDEWASGTVRHILQSEVYAGAAAFNRTSKKMLGDRVTNPENEWITVANAFPAIVSAESVRKARKRFSANRRVTRSDEEMLDALSKLLERHGYLSQKLVAQSRATASTELYHQRFGSLGTAFGLVGYGTEHYATVLAHRRAIRAQRTEMAGQLRLNLEARGLATRALKPSQFEVGGLRVSTIAVGRSSRGRPGDFWDAHFPAEPTDLIVAARCSDDFSGVLDYRILERAAFSADHVSIGPGCRSERDAAAATNLDELSALLAGRLSSDRLVHPARL